MRPLGGAMAVVLGSAMAVALGGALASALVSPTVAVAANGPSESSPWDGLTSAAVRSWVIESFDARITVLRSGEIVVTETIRPRFDGSFNGIYRSIPIDYRTPTRFSYKLRLSVESVTDERGNELRHEIDREDGYLKIKVWIPDAVDATRTVALRYRVKRALRHFDADEERDGIAQA